MRFLYKRGRGARRRVMHLAGHDPLTGDVVMRPLCGRVSLPFDTTCNLPLGQRTCKHCAAAVQRTTTGSET